MCFVYFTNTLWTRAYANEVLKTIRPWLYFVYLCHWWSPWIDLFSPTMCDDWRRRRPPIIYCIVEWLCHFDKIIAILCKSFWWLLCIAVFADNHDRVPTENLLAIIPAFQTIKPPTPASMQYSLIWKKNRGFMYNNVTIRAQNVVDCTYYASHHGR